MPDVRRCALVHVRGDVAVELVQIPVRRAEQRIRAESEGSADSIAIASDQAKQRAVADWRLLPSHCPL